MSGPNREVKRSSSPAWEALRLIEGGLSREKGSDRPPVVDLGPPGNVRYADVPGRFRIVYASGDTDLMSREETALLYRFAEEHDAEPEEVLAEFFVFASKGILDHWKSLETQEERDAYSKQLADGLDALHREDRELGLLGD